MGTFAALALKTDLTTPVSLNCTPKSKWAPQLSCDMLKQIIRQRIYQCVVILVFHFLGARILGFTDTNDKRITTLVFNVVIFVQIFHELNCPQHRPRA
jgi:Ca2+-transporting ATPase